MAFSPSLLLPSTASFHGQRLPATVPFPSPRHVGYRGPVSVRATSSIGLVDKPESARATSSIVLVDKSESEKVNRLKTTYLEKIVPLLKEEFNYGNVHEIPKLEKIVVNCGIGDAAQNAKGLDAAVNELALILGQRPIKTRARKSVATFKIREGMPLGIAATLRGKLMYSFLDRLINLALPRTRDFQGVSPNSFDGHGNYAVGIQELIVFPELKFDAVTKNRGIDVCIKTSAKTDKEAQRLLALMGMPFTEEEGETSTGAPRKKKLKAHHFAMKGGKGGRR